MCRVQTLLNVSYSASTTTTTTTYTVAVAAAAAAATTTTTNTTSILRILRQSCLSVTASTLWNSLPAAATWFTLTLTVTTKLH